MPGRSFTFRIEFREAFPRSYTVLHDDRAIEVDGASVTKARRVNGRTD